MLVQSLSSKDALLWKSGILWVYETNLVCSDSWVVHKRKAALLCCSKFKAAAKRKRIILLGERRETNLYQRKFRLDFRKTFLMIELVKHCKRFSGKDMESAELEIFKN